MERILNIEKTKNADVVVAGGGTAGVFAAISAARTGASVVLLEKNSILGGTMTVAGVNFPGLFFAWGKQIIAGPCWESVERTIRLGGAQMPKISFKPEKHWYEQIRLNRFIYTAVLFEMCEEAGVEIICNSMIGSVSETEDGVKITATTKDGLMEVDSKCAIDATGDGNLSVLAGFKTEKSKTLQPATLQNHISGYDIENVSLDEIQSKLEDSELDDHITAQALYAHLKKGVLDIHIPCKSADTSEGKTRLEQRAYSTLLKVYKFLRGISGLEKLEIDFSAEETGVRETNRVIGESIVTAEDYINGRFYEDSVCYAFYPIDLHVLTGIQKTFHKENVVSKVPYSALVPKSSSRILCCGRCISSDTNANSALRVEAVCMATGQAAGCAAAICAKQDISVQEISFNELCHALKAIGAIVPD